MSNAPAVPVTPEEDEAWDMLEKKSLREPPNSTNPVAEPEKREWVGLTDNEITQCWIQKHDHDVGAIYAFACAIEAKLKEKNT
jgi:hypothetical protein